MSISSFVDLLRLPQTQPLMPEGNMADMQMSVIIDAVKKEIWFRMGYCWIKFCFTRQNYAQNYSRSHSPSWWASKKHCKSVWNEKESFKGANGWHASFMSPVNCHYGNKIVHFIYIWLLWTTYMLFEKLLTKFELMDT